MTDGPTPLSTLSVGDVATVADVRCDRPVARRLMEMGVLRGTEIRVVRVAPLGDPIQLFLRGYHLVVRRADASEITVVKSNGESKP